MATSAFVQAMSKSKTLGKALKAARAAKDDRKVSAITDGKYEARLTRIAATLDPKAKKPVVQATFVIHGGDFDGDVLRQSWRLYAESGKSARGEWERTEEQAYERFAVDMQRLGKKTEWESGADVEETIAELAAEKPLTSITVKRSAADYPNLYINGLATDETVEDDEEEGGEEEEQEEEEEEEGEEEEGDDEEVADDEGSSEEEEEEEEEEQEEVVIAKKDQVYYKPQGSKKKVLCNVVASNPKKKTCDLLDPATKKTYKNLLWGQVEPITE